MHSLQRAVLAITCILMASTIPNVASARPVSFPARDGVEIFGDFSPAKGRPRGTIVLFHMAGSNRAEYGPLAPVLNEYGFATLAIDQRSGGSLWGSANQTASKAKRSYDFADAIPDLEAAISYAGEQKTGPIAIWGSSYTAALVFIVAAKHPEVKALLAFSPGEYVKGYSIEGEARKLSIPAFLTSASDRSEIDAAKVLADAVPAHLAIQYIPNRGVHGSSTLASRRESSWFGGKLEACEELSRPDFSEAAGRLIDAGGEPSSYCSSGERTEATDETQGFMKVVVSAADDRILGFTMIGSEAGEVMGIVQTAILAEIPYYKLRDTVFAHHTIAEGLGPLLGNVPPRT